MVLQRESVVPIWGYAPPGSEIEIQPSWTGKIKVKAGSDSKWIARVKTGKAGGPYSIEFKWGENGQKKIEDILFGEVWLCSGQSNMEWPMTGIGKPLKNGPENIAAANKPNIRLYQVPNKMTTEPLFQPDSQWVVCTPETVKNFSAVGYHFGAYLQEALNVPIGLIDATWGGTDIELWISEKGLRGDKNLAPKVDEKLATAIPNPEALGKRTKALDDDLATADEKLKSDSKGWKSLAKLEKFEAITGKAYDGSIWFRAEVEVPTGEENGAANLVLGQIDDHAIAWVNGIEVGKSSAPVTSQNYSLNQGVLKAGKNLVVVRVVDTGGPGGFDEPQKICVQIGENKYSLKNWEYQLGANITNLPSSNPYHSAAALYNGMIAPVVPYAIRGAIWYQGENNVNRAYQYRTTMQTLIKDWRARFQRGNFPFYMVQIAPYLYNNQGRSAELRDAQAWAVQNTPNTGMAVTMDLVDDLSDIHPTDKQSVGERLSRLALRRTYGFKNVADSGPTYAGFTKEGSKIRIKFKDAKGLHFKGEPLGVTIAGSDLVFRPAQVAIERDTLVVWQDGLNDPQAVRFGWGDAIPTNLYNDAGLPAPPFRTDNFPLLTHGVSW